MANALTITIDDTKKRATCREVVALCGQYTVNVSPAMTGNGFLVLFRKHVLYPPKGSPVYQGGASVNEKTDQWDANEVYAVVPLSTASGVTSGTMSLQYTQLVRDMVSRYGVGAEVPLKYEVYDAAQGGLAGSGEFRLKVVEPYTITEDQSLVLFKGQQGEPGKQGKQGDKGDDGDAAGFATPEATAETLAEGEDATVAVTATGANTAKKFAFKFGLPRGLQGNKGDEGKQGVPASVVQVLDPDTGKWHYLHAVKNANGYWCLALDQDESERDVGYIVPQGGEKGQVIAKNSDKDYDVKWVALETTVTAEEKAYWNSMASNVHSHDNKTVLDKLTQDLLTAWNGAVSNSHTHSNKPVLDEITSTKTSAWDGAATNSHTHANKTALDAISATKTSAWDAAATNSHTHANKDALDSVTADKVSSWESAASNSHTHANKAIIDNLAYKIVVTDTTPTDPASDTIYFITGS